VTLARVHIDSWRRAYRGLVPDAHLAELDYTRGAKRFEQSLSTNSEETYAALQSGQIVGFITLGACRDTDVDQESTGEIWGIYLAPEHWRKGIGRTLCKWAEAKLVSRGHSVAVLWVFTGNDQACRFYEAMGFAVDGDNKDAELWQRTGGHPISETLGGCTGPQGCLLLMRRRNCRSVPAG